MKISLKLSDKILLIFFLFSSVLILMVKFFVGGSIQQILILCNFIYIFAFIITYTVSKKFSDDIIKLTFKVEEMAAGNISNRIQFSRKDEIGQLVNALNELIGRLQTGIALDLSKHKELSRAKTDFVALASHQLRTPLSIIKWYIDFLITGDAGAITDEQKKYLKEVYASNERLIELVNGLLDASRIDLGTFSIEPEPTNIIERAETALVKFLPQIKQKNIILKKNFDEFPIINLDPRLTKIVFENIISNAVKYTPPEGTIHFSIKKTEKDIYIKISDTGCGIPREQQPKVFTKLFRADNVKKIEASGTGLGLYIVKAVIEKSGGKIWFESPSLELLLAKGEKNADIPIDKRNRGTTFFFTIPLKGMKSKPGTKKLTSLE
jgi:signal transduction histidine kinase